MEEGPRTMTHPKLVETMSRPDFYPHRPEQVELIQTHISYIFIAGDYVYKVKKPVDFGFLDFTTLDKREFYCREELRLNRRLAPAVYLEVVEIGEDAGGNISFGIKDRIVEYAVKMLKIPLNGMLKTLLHQDKANRSIMDAIAKKLVHFHRGAATGGVIDEMGGVETIRRNHDENFTQTESYINITIPPGQYHFIRSYIYSFMDTHHDLFIRRVAHQRIRDCHGDLHLEHICIMEPGDTHHKEYNPDNIVIFDCIEFNERFRYEDVAAEVAFLAMDLDYNGYEDYDEVFVNAYIKHSGDREIGTLLNFYKCYYAYVRGKVIGFRIHDSSIRNEERKDAAKTASRYFDLAFTYAARTERPTLILMAGLMGTGKSVRARSIAPRLGADIIQTDVLRKQILNIVPHERHYEDFGKGIYGEEFTHKTYEKALAVASEKLRNGKSVIIDASYKNRRYRLDAAHAARKLHADYFVIECVCPENIIQERLESRTSKKGQVSDGRWELYRAQKASFEEINEIPERSHIVLDTSLPPEECTYIVLQKMKDFTSYHPTHP
ncbi:MAG TPA: aminoglycoside phosphotransferase [Syntrophaceae bacterium]|jgi:aminoglycoside phosphotransferase family enzyme/predicted kinase|nr:aminoglycoside phosphotransferase [Syntrophaceae bacterium]